LSSFEQITHYAKGKRLALFLDYDGTLSPIVDNPDSAFMSDEVSVLSISSVASDLDNFTIFLLRLVMFYLR